MLKVARFEGTDKGMFGVEHFPSILNLRWKRVGSGSDIAAL